MLILNKTAVVQNIKIVDKDGRADSISLQARGSRPVSLPPGAVLDPTMLGVYKDILRTDPPIVVPGASPAVVDASE